MPAILPLCKLPRIFLTLLLLALTAGPLRSDERPNFLLFLVDDLGARDLSMDGSTFHETPRLDAFARTALRFTQGYASHPVCSPTRAALMTGKNPARLRITDWIPGNDPKNRPLLGPRDRHALPLDEVTLAERLGAAGYETFFAGKWHLGGEGHLPEDQGFDHNHGGHHRGSPPGGYYSPYRNPQLEDGPPGEYLTDRLADETIAFLQTPREKPFFAMLSFYTVHTPIQAARRHIDHFEKKLGELPPATRPAQVPEHSGQTRTRQDNAPYASMVHAMDENFGRVLEALEKAGLRESTAIAFTSDNGGLSTLNRRGGPTSNAPLRAGKGWCYEGGVRVPFLIRVPEQKTCGDDCAVPVWTADLYPTFLALAGIESTPGEHPDGVDLGPLLRGEKALARPSDLVWHYPHYHGSAWKPGSAIRAGDWKLIEFYEERRVELYSLSADPREQRDLAEEHPALVGNFSKRMHDYLRQVDAQMPRLNPGAVPEKRDEKAAVSPRSTPQRKPGNETLQFDGASRHVYQTRGDVSLCAWVFQPTPAAAPKPDPRPAIVFYFGGGWSGGTPEQFEPHARYLASRGMASVLVDYRVRSRHGTGAQECVEDAKSALRWLRENAEKFRVDPDRIVAAGGSAGGHLAAATGLVPGFEGTASTSSKPNALVLFNPGLVLASIGDYQYETMGWTRGKLPADPESISPAHHIDEKAPPTIIFHGLADRTVPHRSAEVFRDLMRAAGQRCELVSYPEAQHGFFNRGRGDGSAWLDTVRRMDRFLAELGYLDGPPEIDRFEQELSRREADTKRTKPAERKR